MQTDFALVTSWPRSMTRMQLAAGHLAAVENMGERIISTVPQE